MLKISIIIATFNSARTIRQTLSSIINQRYTNIELIVIDGGSSDSTLEIIKEYEPYISYYCSEADNGIYDAFNKGVRKATGDYIEFIGSDDCLCNENIIEEIVDYIQENPCDILSGNIYLIDELYCLQRIYTNDRARNFSTYKGGMIPHAGMFVSSKVFKKYLFDTSYKLAGDYKFFLECYYDKTIKFRYIDLCVCFFATTGISSTQRQIAIDENNRIYNELGISFDVNKKNTSNTLKCKVKNLCMDILKILGLYHIEKKFMLKVFYGWEKHHCNNKICRWCNRYEKR